MRIDFKGANYYRPVGLAYIATGSEAGPGFEAHDGDLIVAMRDGESASHTQVVSAERVDDFLRGGGVAVLPGVPQYRGGQARVDLGLEPVRAMRLEGSGKWITTRGNGEIDLVDDLLFQRYFVPEAVVRKGSARVPPPNGVAAGRAALDVYAKYRRAEVGAHLT